MDLEPRLRNGAVIADPTCVLGRPRFPLARECDGYQAGDDPAAGIQDDSDDPVSDGGE